MIKDFKIIIYNPHIADFIGKPLFYILNNRFASKKFQYLWKYINENPDKFIFYIDKSSIPRQLGILSRIVPKSIEIFFWCLLNKINPFRIKKLYSEKELGLYKNNTILFWFIFDNLNYSWWEIPHFEWIKLFHLNHYFSNIRIVNENLEKNSIDFLIAENNLYKNSDYYKKYISNKNVYVLPYAFQDRFKRIKDFNHRENLCFSTWNYFLMDDIAKKTYLKEYFEFFHEDTFHPIRKEIAQKSWELKRFINCYNSLYNAWAKKGNDLLSKIYNSLKSYGNYKKFNIVEKYNDYVMFVAWEELCGLPPVSFVEGMACGSAYIWLDDPMYKDLWMLPGVHYIGYDGTLWDLLKKISYYQENSGELRNIAECWYRFVQEKLSGPVVARKFIADIENLFEEYLRSDKKKEGLLFPSSFLLKK